MQALQTVSKLLKDFLAWFCKRWGKKVTSWEEKHVCSSFIVFSKERGTHWIIKGIKSFIVWGLRSWLMPYNIPRDWWRDATLIKFSINKTCCTFVKLFVVLMLCILLNGISLESALSQESLSRILELTEWGNKIRKIKRFWQTN